MKIKQNNIKERHSMKVSFKRVTLCWLLFCTSALWLFYAGYFYFTLQKEIQNINTSGIFNLSVNTGVVRVDKSSFWNSVSAAFTGKSRVLTHDVIDALRHFRITSASVMKEKDITLRNHLNTTIDLGTTHKWLLTLEGGQRVIFKPDWKTPGAGYWFEDFENPLNELLSFQVDRVLGFNRTPYAVGRSIHLRTEILPVASKALMHYIEPNHMEYCLMDKCYFCKEYLKVCTQSGKLQGVIIYFVDNVSLPTSFPWDINHYHRFQKYGFNNQTACTLARRGTIFESNLHFSSLMDLIVLDLLTHHFDSKYYYTKGSSSAKAVYIDRGRSFSNDEYQSKREPQVNIIGLWQCCRISYSTFDRIKGIQWSAVRSQIISNIRTDDLFTTWNRRKIMKYLGGMKDKMDYLQNLLKKCHKLNHDQMFIST